jgi:hypothetical protein
MDPAALTLRSDPRVCKFRDVASALRAPGAILPIGSARPLDGGLIVPLVCRHMAAI